MGREIKPGRWSMLLVFDNKADEVSRSGLDLINKLNMDQYSAPKQTTLRGIPLHCLRRRATEGSHHLADGDNVPGRHIQHGRQVQERSVQLRPIAR